ncbi:RDD family protein [Agromyces sp. SYSU T00194]|uniref:RDD family protein n=1 Tax=Agromyces chitinivorans TaxID=3158560 RepID=UPI003393003A
MPENPTTFGQLPPSEWPGERLGLPETGPGSVGRVGRRILAICIDWLIANLIPLLWASYASNVHSWSTLAVFAVMQVLFIPTIGGSIGHRITGMRVIALDGGWVGLRRPVVRTLLLVIVVPALIWDSDQRGFHDKVAGTVLIRA